MFFFVNTEGTRSIPRSFVDLYGIEQEVAIETSIWVWWCIMFVHKCNEHHIMFLWIISTMVNDNFEWTSFNENPRGDN